MCQICPHWLCEKLGAVSLKLQEFGDGSPRYLIQALQQCFSLNLRANTLQIEIYNG